VNLIANASLKGSDWFADKSRVRSYAIDVHRLRRHRYRASEIRRRMERVKNEIQELHAKEVGVGNPSEERASS